MSADARSPLLSVQQEEDAKGLRRAASAGKSKMASLMARKPVYVAMIVLIFVVSVLIVVIAIRNWKTGFSADLVLWQRKGITLTNGKYCSWVKYGDPRTQLALGNLQTTGANWVQVVVTQFQENSNSTKIEPGVLTASDADLTTVIKGAIDMNLAVALVLQVDLPSFEGRYARRKIGKHFSSAMWDDWFKSYTTTVLQYAQLAEKTGVSLFTIGYELPEASPLANKWNALAAAVRNVYHGAITYAAMNGGEETKITWWGNMSVIGVNAFYEFSNSDNPKKLAKQWKGIIEDGTGAMSMGLKPLSKAFNKTVLFTSLGYCSGKCPTNPEGIVDLVEQENLYTAAMVALGYEPWFDGAFFFNWDTDPGFGGQDNYCMTPQGKPAEQVLRNYFGATDVPTPYKRKAECPCVIQ
jgi:Glycoside Hydrolase Family 113